MDFFNKNLKRRLSFVVVVIIFLTIIVMSQAPKSFPEKAFSFHVGKSSGISKVADDLYSKNIIHSPFLFKVFATIISFKKGIQAGDYRFVEKQNVIKIAYRMVKGYQSQPKIRVTIPEGTNVNDMAFIFLKSLTDFNAPLFVSLAKKYEGYLYPDTYYFLANASPDEIVKVMRENFDKKIATVQDKIKASGHTLSDIIIMASIVEKETNADESRKIVAGILWKRLEKNMYLQVDAPFYYTTGKAGGFTLDDLKVKSPYNTYLNKGLPIGPITNPSLATILDTIDPVKTSYYFYLNGSDGAIHYATTFDGHLANKNIYLK